MKKSGKFISILLHAAAFAVSLNSCGSAPLPPPVQEQLSVQNVSFKMIRLQAMDFPGGPIDAIGLPDIRPEVIGVGNDYWLAETNTTWELWKKVYDWAVENGYDFNRPGRMGSEYDGTGMNDQHPVTVVDWTSAAVWCNALTELYNNNNNTQYKQVYRHEGEVLRKTVLRKTEDSIIADPQADGFRLPTSLEWEMVARFTLTPDESCRQYPKRSGRYWLPFVTVSGEPEYMIDKGNMGGNVEYGSIKSRPVQELKRNVLGFTGFTGNDGKLWQWCYEFLLYRENSKDSFHKKRGGSRTPRCGRHEYWPRDKEIKTDETCNGFNQVTFRMARNAE